jgi:ATP-dependent DNA helicase RecG
MKAAIQTDNYCSSLRNKLVAEGLYRFNAVEKHGSGFIRIRQALQDYPEVSFNIKELQGGVMATFAQMLPVSPDEGVSEGVNSLFQLIRAGSGLCTPALAEALHASPKNIERWLKQLKENGLIEFRGATKTGGYYAVLAKTVPTKGRN